MFVFCFSIPLQPSFCFFPPSLYIGDEISATASTTTDLFAHPSPSSPSYPTYSDQPYNPHIHGSAVVCQWGCRAINNLAKSKALRARLVEAGVVGVLERVVRRYSQYSDVAEDKGVYEWASLARESVLEGGK